MSYICPRCKTIYSSEEYAKDKFCTKCDTFLKKHQETRIRKITFTKHEEDSNYWIIPVKQAASINRSIVKEKIWAYGIDTPGRNLIKPKDWACFYLSKHGIVAHAEILTYPKKMEHPRVNDPEKYNWVFNLGNISVYLEHPLKISLFIRKQLDAFQKSDPLLTKNAIDSWGLFVQNNKRISLHDFKIFICILRVRSARAIN